MDRIELDRIVYSLDGKIAQVKRDTDDLSQAIDAIREGLEVAERERDNLVSYCEELESMASNLENAIDDAENECDAFEEEIADLKDAQK